MKPFFAALKFDPQRLWVFATLPWSNLSRFYDCAYARQMKDPNLINFSLLHKLCVESKEKLENWKEREKKGNKSRWEK